MAGPTAGQKAAGRHARTRRVELSLDQDELAALAVDVSARTIRSFERGQRWPQDRKLMAIERALGWRAGHLSDYAARYDEQQQQTTDPDIRAILNSDMDPDDKARLIATLRSIRSPAEGRGRRDDPPDLSGQSVG